MIIKKYLSICVLLLVLLPSLNIVNGYSDFKSADISNLTFKQEIEIPIDTSLEQAKFQPIDIRVSFSEKCYAKNEIENSVRIGCDIGSELLELESQIYDLEHTDDSHISDCSVVFLIPNCADGTEKYYLFYESEETEPVDYEKHLRIEDTHYFYEPISGQKVDFDYYGIYQDEEVVYGVIQTGELLGNPIAQNIGRFKPGSKVVETYNIDQLAGFDMRYGINDEPGYYGTTWANEVEKNILVEGNLMVRMRISCKTPDGSIKTDNIYTYYYCPSETKKILVNCHHEVLEDINIEDPELYDGTYAGLVSIKSRSATIEKMNVGDILPEINIYSEDEILKDYEVPQNPDSSKKEAVLSTEADIDLGSKAWISLADPSSGKNHGLIMESSDGINADEDGVQVKAWVKQNVKLPGLEADTGNVFLMRNAYEKSTGHNTELKKGFKADYNIEFVSAESNGKSIIDSESAIFKELVKNIPFDRETTSKQEEEVTERFNLEAYVHLAPSVPLGSLLSAALGKNISYIYAELYKEESFKSSGSAGRISLASMDIDFEGKSLVEKIKMAVGLFDWRNASIFKKIVFPDLEPGTYIVKIFRENPLFAKERQFIGFSAVNVEKDTTSRIYCTVQGNMNINVFDQDDKPVENVVFSLFYNDEEISKQTSSENGTCLLNAPCKPNDEYVLKAFYNGFLVHEQPVKLKLINHFKNYNVLLSIEYYDVALNIKDSWGFAPAVDVKPVLTSDEMVIPTTISSSKISDGEYIFTDVTPGKYTISTSYKSFEKTEEINVENNKEINLVFPAEYTIDFSTYDSYAQSLSNGEIIVKRNGKQETIEINEEGKTSISVPPASYEITIVSDDKEIGKINLQVRSDKTTELLTKKDSIIHTFALICGLILAAFSFYLAFVKKQRYNGLKLFVISLLLISIFSPWWSLNGDNGAVQTSTNILVFPQKIVTLTSSSEIIGGEISQVPEEATMVLEILFMILLAAILFNLVTIFTKKRFKKITKIFSILNFVFLILLVILFYVIISQLTQIGVGSVMGSGNLDVNIPGQIESAGINCSWGPAISFYLAVFIVVMLSALQFFKTKIIMFLERKNL